MLLVLAVLLLCSGAAALLNNTDTRSKSPYLRLPVFVHSRLPLVHKEFFDPTAGTGLETLPGQVRDILLPVLPGTGAPRVPVEPVSIRCSRNKLQVRVRKSVLGPGTSQYHLRLGTCNASQYSRDSIDFDHDLDLCGTTRTVINNQIVFSNVLHYDPPRGPGPIRRTGAFMVPVVCHYNRYHYSYKIGYRPKIRLRKIHKPMKNREKLILTARNAEWERLSASDHYSLGKPMYFQAEAPSVSQHERLYIHMCYATPRNPRTSTPQFPVVANFGCMVESKYSHSRFIPYKNNIVRFTVDSFLFKGITSQLPQEQRLFLD
ncbi:zona pellucida sperm-binding protein 3-like [Thalassophryne amazonica]|uniref:zona pellucida sperm-binding protein 3-like n=1 Tax=Thalassophryne amazonica TaxID=390379 RepID=UPI001470F03D|nr:zona pellucida sperm-binding protein 3-like [Thalassophryne amazonica]